MRRLIHTAAALALTATPVLGVLAAVHPGGFMADDGIVNSKNGVIRSNEGGVISADKVILAEGGVISTNIVTPADNGVINADGVITPDDNGVIHVE